MSIGNVTSKYQELECGVPSFTRRGVRRACQQLREASASSEELADQLGTCFEFKQLERWAASQTPLAPSTTSDDLLHVATLRCPGSVERTQLLHRRLLRAYRVVDEPWCPTPAGRGRCEHCVCNNVCMAEGCTARPLACVGKSTGFRCLPGVHLCNKHGLRVNVNNQRPPRNDTVLLKDGRQVDHVFSQSAYPNRKRRARVPPTDGPCSRVKVARARRARDARWLGAMAIAELVAERGWEERTLDDVLLALRREEGESTPPLGGGWTPPSRASVPPPLFVVDPGGVATRSRAGEPKESSSSLALSPRRVDSVHAGSPFHAARAPVAGRPRDSI